MKAVIMAGGEGTRLRPMTCACPKPMVPLFDKPVMEYALSLLVRHGVQNAYATLLYLPERITDYFGDGSEFGLNLFYRTETKPLGTAGSVKAAADFLDEPFVVLSGDGLTDCDLTDAYRFHREKGALATMVLKKVAAPLEYGVVVTDASGRVQRFVEKPGWGEVCSDAVNTGIYLLEPEALSYIPDDRPYDFGREFFPKLVEAGEKVYGYPMRGYWCDIGDTASYLRAHMDLLDGKMSLPERLIARQSGAQIDPSAILESPYYIGAGAKIEAGARIGPYTVLSAGATVCAGASVKRSVLWRGAQAGERTQLRGAVLCTGGRLLPAAAAFEECVVGEGATVGESALLLPGVKIWPHKRVDDGERIDQNVVWGHGAGRALVHGVLPIAAPSQIVRDAQAYVEALRTREVLIARDESAVGYACSRAVVAGLMAQGAQVIDIGTATRMQLRHAQRKTGVTGALHIARDGLLPLSDTGCVLSKDEARRLFGRLSSEDYAMPFSSVTHPPISMAHTELSYIQELLRTSGAGFEPSDAPRVALYAQYEQILSLGESALHRAALAPRAEWEEELMELAPGEVGIWLSETGEHVRFADEKGLLTEAETTLILCYAAWALGCREMILPRGATRGAASFCERHEMPYSWTSSSESVYQRALLVADPRLFDLFFDGLFAALVVLRVLHANRLTLREVLLDTQPLYQRHRTVPVALEDKGRLLQKLAGALPGADVSDGILLEKADGWAWISPGGDKRACEVFSEAPDAEIAKELCDFCLDRIEHALREE